MMRFKLPLLTLLIALLLAGTAMAQNSSEETIISGEDAVSAARTLFPEEIVEEVNLEETASRQYWNVSYASGIDVHVDALTSEVFAAAYQVRIDHGGGSTTDFTVQVPPSFLDQEFSTTVDDAVSAAQLIYPGLDVVRIELEEDESRLYWEVTFDDGHEVDVSTLTGNVLFFGYDIPARRSFFNDNDDDDRNDDDDDDRNDDDDGHNDDDDDDDRNDDNDD